MKSLEKSELVRAGKDQQESLASIDFVSSRWLKVLIKTLPWTLLVYALIMYILSSNIPPQTENRLDILQITGFIAYAVIFFPGSNSFYQNISIDLGALGKEHIPSGCKVEFGTVLKTFGKLG